MSCCDASPIVIRNIITNLPMMVTVQSITLDSGALMTDNDPSGTPVSVGTAVPLGKTTTWYAFSTNGSRGAVQASITLQIQWLSQITTLAFGFELTPKNHGGDPPCSATYSLWDESSGHCFGISGVDPVYNAGSDGPPTLTWVLEWSSQDGCTNPPGPDVKSWTAPAPQGGIWQPGNQVQYGVQWLNAQGGYEYGSQIYWGPVYDITNQAYPVVADIPTDPTGAGYVRWLMRQNPQHPGATYLHSFGTDNTTTTYTDTND